MPLHAGYPICYLLLGIAVAITLWSMYMKSVVLLFKAGLYSVVLNKMKVDRLVGTSATTGKLINRTAGLLRQTCYDVSWYSNG